MLAVSKLIAPKFIMKLRDDGRLKASLLLVSWNEAFDDTWPKRFSYLSTPVAASSLRKIFKTVTCVDDVRQKPFNIYISSFDL